MEKVYILTQKDLENLQSISCRVKDLLHTASSIEESTGPSYFVEEIRRQADRISSTLKDTLDLP